MRRKNMDDFAIVRIISSQQRTNIKKQKASLVWEAFLQRKLFFISAK
jgi:hypothetical protein